MSNQLVKWLSIFYQTIFVIQFEFVVTWYTVTVGQFWYVIVKLNCWIVYSQEDQDAGLSVGQRKRVKLSSSTKGKCKENVMDFNKLLDLSI